MVNKLRTGTTSGFDSRRYQTFWEVADLEQGPLSLMSTNEKILWRKSSGSGLQNRDYGRRDPSRWPPQKLALTSPTSGGCSIGTVPSRTQATEYIYIFFFSFSLQRRVYTWCFCKTYYWMTSWATLHHTRPDGQPQGVEVWWAVALFINVVVTWDFCPAQMPTCNLLLYVLWCVRAVVRKLGETPPGMSWDMREIVSKRKIHQK
jgi:hypothetical protein